MSKILMSRETNGFQLLERDREISLIAWGFTLGFGYLTAWKGYKLTLRIPRNKRYRSMYFWLVWLEVVSIFGYGCLTWLHVQDYTPSTFPLFFFIWFFWTIQSHTQPQIIINRISVIIVDKRKTTLIRRSVFILIWVLCIISGVVWIGGSMQINERFITGDNVYTRVEGGIFLSVDAFLNVYFMICVKKHLIDSGLEKYRPLMNFVFRIIILSLALDLVILGMMSYQNPRMWLQFHPLGFIVKLNIELSMADLIAKLARQRDFKAALELSQNTTISDARDCNFISVPGTTSHFQTTPDGLDSEITRPQGVFDIESLRGRNTSGFAKETIVTYEHDESPLQEERDWDRSMLRNSQV